MATWRAGSPSHSHATLATAVVALVLAVFVARADSTAAHANVWVTGLDIAVGLAFIGAAVAAGGPLPERGLVALVGVAWLAASLLPVARPWHWAVLVVALTAFPRGRVRGKLGWLFVALAAMVAVGLVSQLGAAAVFGAVAVTAGLGLPSNTAQFPSAAGTGLASVLGAEWAVGRQGSLDPTFGLVAYEAVLLAVAVSFPFAAHAVVRKRAALADQLLSDPRVPALDGLAAILGQALGDGSVQVYQWQGSGYVDGRGRGIAVPNGGDQWLEIADAVGPVAAVSHNSVALRDPPTTAAVSSAVRLVVTHIRLQEEQRDRLREQEAARARIVAATDRQRQQVASELRRDVEPALDAARADLDAARRAVGRPTVATALDTVANELSTASAQIADLVAGIPPVLLGGGRLSAALTALAATSPLPVRVTIFDGAAADRGTETTLFYVCSEALANAIKHAHASSVGVGVRLADDSIIVTIADDGCGGADPAGSGLQGLADRVAAHGGRFRVDSPPGAGTTVTATVPSSRSSCRA